VVEYLRGRDDIDPKRIALWGDSFAGVNPPDRNFRVPHRIDGRPECSEPLGGLLALLGAVYDDDIRAVYVRGGLSDFRSVLDQPFVYIPHDVLVPGLLTTGDLPDLAAAVAPRPLRLGELVDGLNRLRPADATRAVYAPAIQSYQDAGCAEDLVLGETTEPAIAWLLRKLHGR
jgi:hypothetical protein